MRSEARSATDAAHQRANRRGSGWATPSGTSNRITRRFRPEALGSPAGYSVPPGLRLLWPHPSLSLPPDDLFVRRRVRWSIGLDRTGNDRVPNLLRASFPTCRSPYPDGLDGCNWQVLPHPRWPSPVLQRLGVHNVRTVGSRAVALTRLQVSLTCYGPKGCSPFTNKDFYFRAFVAGVTPQRRRILLRGQLPLPATGLSPARNTALWAAQWSSGGAGILPPPPSSNRTGGFPASGFPESFSLSGVHR